ncbi:aminotransferase class V-fold PLP-dependent enzyme, partial [Pantoea dispersa]|uniref:aminotransferase class V-fold PLP-dependent enzyme n=1 Tax=Pantoea dispersa TaxID=59814 RepID=UPI0024B6EB69
VSALPVDLMSFSAPPLYGPKGIGALLVRRTPHLPLYAPLHGGGHARGMRSGTLPVPQFVGMGDAYRLAREEMADESARLATLRHRLWQGIRTLSDVPLNG